MQYHPPPPPFLHNCLPGGLPIVFLILGAQSSNQEQPTSRRSRGQDYPNTNMIFKHSKMMNNEYGNIKKIKIALYYFIHWTLSSISLKSWMGPKSVCTISPLRYLVSCPHPSPSGRQIDGARARRRTFYRPRALQYQQSQGPLVVLLSPTLFRLDVDWLQHAISAPVLRKLRYTLC